MQPTSECPTGAYRHPRQSSGPRFHPVNPKVTVLYHYALASYGLVLGSKLYVTFTPWNATDQERGVKEIKNFGYNGVVIQSQDADIF